MGPGPGFGEPPLFFVIAASFVGLMVALVFGKIIYRVLSTWMRNNASPLRTARAKVIGKRSEVSGGGNDTSVSTWYFVAFELENEDRVELPVRGDQFGILFENDQGMLTWQGTRFKGFDRVR